MVSLGMSSTQVQQATVSWREAHAGLNLHITTWSGRGDLRGHLHLTVVHGSSLTCQKSRLNCQHDETSSVSGRSNTVLLPV